MRIPIAAALILILLQFAADTYLHFIVKKRCGRERCVRIVDCQALFFILLVVAVCCMPKRGTTDFLLTTQMWLLFFDLSVYASKLGFIIIDLLASIPKIFGLKRLKALSEAGAAIAAVIFVAMWWGALINRNRMQVIEENIEIAGLPQSFDGYRIVQISDLHTGTFGSDTTFVHNLVERINSLNPNLIVFTGDIVNRHTSELPPFVEPLSRLSAPDGVISILGNHDYGDYFKWDSDTEKEQNMEWLMDLQIEMGWELLTNSSITIYGHSPADSLVIVGVENWGDAPFPRYGNLSEAYPTPADSAVKILLTHNPAHWVEEIAPVDTMNYALTLSGHTHAMQMEIAGFSPAKWRYPTWGGLYEAPSDSTRKLYVNIGAGTVGIPMRLGATPEITVFNLYTDK